MPDTQFTGPSNNGAAKPKDDDRRRSHAIREPSTASRDERRLAAELMTATGDTFPSVSALSRARDLVTLIFGPPQARWFSVRYWDGTVERPADGPINDRLVVVFNSAAALWRMCLPPSELRMGEAFVRGDLDIEGSVERAAAIADTVKMRVRSGAALFRVCRAALALGAATGAETAARTKKPQPRTQLRALPRHTPRREAAAVRAHYDVDPRFFQLWLDDDMVYSCGYFPTGRESIDTAQQAKLDHLCRKLRLKSGERLLDIGCGWGALIRHAAAYYDVHATGVTLSASQAEIANARIVDDGLAGRCVAYVRDYRELNEDVPFDKIVSVGMFEHVGLAQLPGYFGKALRLLKPGGLFLNHGIVTAPDRERGWISRLGKRVWREGAFMDRYVFPDGELVTLDAAVRCAEQAGFEVRDVESLREHYVLTLRHWVGRLEHARESAIALVGHEIFRTWRLYMAASAHAFKTSRIGVAQVLLGRPDRSGWVDMPLTRADIYASRLVHGSA